MKKQICGCGVVQVVLLEAFEDVVLWVAELFDTAYNGFLDDDVLGEELLLV